MKLIKTTVFRTALRSAVIFVLISASSLLSVYYVTFEEIVAQTDKMLHLEAEEFQKTFDEKGYAALTEMIMVRNQSGHYIQRSYALLNGQGDFVSGSRELATEVNGFDFSHAQDVLLEVGGTGDNNEAHEQDQRIILKSLDQNNWLLISEPQFLLLELREHTFSAVLLAIVITIVLVILIGVYMSRVVMTHISSIDDGIQQSIESGFKNKVPVPQEEDEFQALTLKLNVMLEKIDKLITGMREVTSNVAHDLRSPLTRLRNRLEITLLNARDTQEYRETMQEGIEDISNLLATFNAMLSIAQARAGIHREPFTNVDLTDLCDELAELYQAAAEEQGRRFSWQGSEKISISGNRRLLAQAISNLLDNAIKYSPIDGVIVFSLSCQEGQAIIAICDKGMGIPPQEYERVFEPFQRLDSARSTSGSGLGLSLVSAIAELHQASVILSDNHPGLCVELEFKLSGTLNKT